MQQKEYQTTQRDAVYSLLSSCPERAMTAREVYMTLKTNGCPIGRTTVFRTVDRFSDQGLLYKIPSKRPHAPVQYQYKGPNTHALNVRCNDCGQVISLDCEFASSFKRHLSHEHGFTLNESECLLPGTCEHCRISQRAPEE